MPTAFPTIFGGLTRGIQAGQRMGLMQDEMKLKKEEMVQKKEADKRKELSSQISNGLALASNPNVPKSMKLPAFNGAITAYNELYGNKDGTGIPTMTEWTDGFGKIAQKASKILNDPKIPATDKPKMILGLIEDESSNSAVQPFFQQAQKDSEEKIKGQQAEIKRQAIPILQKIKKGGFPSLTNEEKTQFAVWQSNPHAQVAIGEAADEIDKGSWAERDPEGYLDIERRKASIGAEFREPERPPVQKEIFSPTGESLGSIPTTQPLQSGQTFTKPKQQKMNMTWMYDNEDWTISKEQYDKILKEQKKQLDLIANKSGYTEQQKINEQMKLITGVAPRYGGKKKVQQIGAQEQGEILKRKPGESIPEYLKRTGQK